MPSVSFKPQPEALGVGEVYATASETRSGMYHFTLWLTSAHPRFGQVYCTCEGFQFRKSCKHIEKTREMRNK